MIKKTLFICIIFLNLSFSSEYFKIVKVPGNLSKVTPLSKAWMSTNYIRVIAYPQKAIITNNLYYKFDNPVTIKIKALYDGKNIAILLKWRDVTKDIEDGHSIKNFADGFSVEFAKNIEDFPYARSGSKDREVVEYFQKAVKSLFPIGLDDILYQFDFNNLNIFNNEEYRDYLEKISINKYQKVFLKKGDTKYILAEESLFMNMIYKDGFWFASLVKKLNSKNLKLNSGFFPILFSVYDGHKKQRGEIKNITKWIIGKFSDINIDDKIANLADKIGLILKGDIQNGKRLFLENCKVCHIDKGFEKALLYQAPNLSFVGGYSITAYLQESLLDPSAVITNGYLPDMSHPDYPWYEISKDGKKISTMPSFGWMDKKDIEDIVSYLQTLK